MKTMTTLCLMISLALMAIFSTLMELKNNKKDKKSPFECGFENLSNKKTTFSTNFITLMMMFLIFDVEISVLIPFSMMSKNNQTSVMMLSNIFIMTLMVLTLKEWKQGSLEWSK